VFLDFAFRFELRKAQIVSGAALFPFSGEMILGGGGIDLGVKRGGTRSGWSVTCWHHSHWVWQWIVIARKWRVSRYNCHSSEANIFKYAERITTRVRNTMAHYRIHKRPPPIPTLSHVNSVHNFQTCALRSGLIIFCYSCHDVALSLLN
jgi:hypothetical protein